MSHPTDTLTLEEKIAAWKAELQFAETEYAHTIAKVQRDEECYMQKFTMPERLMVRDSETHSVSTVADLMTFLENRNIPENEYASWFISGYDGDAELYREYQRLENDEEYSKRVRDERSHFLNRARQEDKAGNNRRKNANSLAAKIRALKRKLDSAQPEPTLTERLSTLKTSLKLTSEQETELNYIMAKLSRWR